MLKLIILKTLNQKALETDRGYAIFEVLVAALISFLFLVGSLQAMVLATVLRIQAQEQALSVQGIQEDIESLKATADNLAANNSLCSATTFANGYADALLAQYFGDVNYAANASSYTLEQPFFGYTMRLNRDFLGDGRLIDGTTGNAADTAESTTPHKILKVRYVVQAIKDSGIEEVTEHYAEIIPNAALQCP